MAPQRMRNALDDSRSESSSTREKQPGSGPNGISKSRRNGSSTLPGSNLKDVTNAHSTIGQPGHQDTAVNVSWDTFLETGKAC